MNKKGALIAVDTLIRLGILLVVIAVVFLGVFPPFQQKLEAAETKSVCEWSILLASVQKLGSAGIAEGIPEGCKAKQVHLTLADVEKGKTLAKNRIQVFKDNPDVYKSQFFTDPSDELQLREFALDKIVGDELVDCWEKVFKGKMPLFDNWWRLYSWDESPPGSGSVAIDSFVGKFHQPPVNCIICARITFDDDVISMFGNKRVDSLQEWLALNPTPRSNTPYLKYLYEGQTDTDSFKPKYSFSVNEQGLAIIYERIISAHEVEKAITYPFRLLGIASDTPDINHLVLVPYTQESIVSLDNGEGCTLIID